MSAASHGARQTSLQRLPNFPNIPTASETIPGFLATGWFALVAPTGTPDAIIRKVNQDLKNVVESEEVRKKFEDLATFGRPMSPEETTAFLHSEQEVWKPTVRKVGFAAQ